MLPGRGDHRRPIFLRCLSSGHIRLFCCWLSPIIVEALDMFVSSQNLLLCIDCNVTCDTTS
ncbi:hypothetical protein HanXRQr2_Chr03g0132041 [Helianthus annuus]|uniref:Uncharacterized protein n=1 Tax=Helianthus annuus TaxID=4232 RepID=A0A9K3JJP9_HELAN|nr:hypothetical protein HanXRQr2_Chr03g0132041 [Helianthus annuus]KAJ0945500.1 hypothetical protein HanPSC8_Chr03g0128861 [Helianthus annuus]